MSDYQVLVENAKKRAEQRRLGQLALVSRSQEKDIHCPPKSAFSNFIYIKPKSVCFAKGF